MAKEKTYTFLNRKKGLYLADAGIKGRGVYCRDKIRKGDLLETTPAIPVSAAQTKHLDKTILVNYAFGVGKLSKKLRRKHRLKPDEEICCVVMGILSYCNHGEEPNAEVSWLEHENTLYYVLRATRDIPADTEICTTYGEGWFEDQEGRRGG
jgi:SET domain-containing protein